MSEDELGSLVFLELADAGVPVSHAVAKQAVSAAIARAKARTIPRKEYRPPGVPAPGRYMRGEARSALLGKGLTEADIRKIRADPRTARVVGKEYGISFVMVSHIRRRTRWACVK